MAIGPGEYDEIATRVCQLTGATAVLVCVADKAGKMGFSVQMKGDDPPSATTIRNLLELAGALRDVAGELEADAKRLTRQMG